jgi:hypothetical protein
MNWGAFGGALASSALNTYERLGEEELRDMQRKQLKKDIAEKEALDAAWRESQARVGQSDDYTQALKTGSNIGTEQAQMLSNQGALSGNTAEDQAFERASAEAATGAMRENAMRQGAIPAGQAAPAMSPTEYTKTKGMEDYVKAAGQISRKGTVEAIQLKQLVRQSENEDKFFTKQEKLNEQLASIQGAADSFGLKGVYDVASKNGVNNLKFVEGKNGVGSRIQVLGPKGDVLETISDSNSAVSKLSEAAMDRFMNESVNLLGSPDKVVAFMQQKRGLALQERAVGVKEKELDVKRPYLDALAGKANAETKALKLSDEVRQAGAKFMEEYNALPPEKRNGPEGQRLLDQAESAMATRSGDVARIRANTPLGRAENQYGKAVEAAAKNDMPPPDRNKFMAQQGFAPDIVVQGQQKKVDDLVRQGKTREAEILVKQHNSVFKHTPISITEQRTALPVPR